MRIETENHLIRQAGVSSAEWSFRVHNYVLLNWDSTKDRRDWAKWLFEQVRAFPDAGGKVKVRRHSDLSTFLDYASREIEVTQYAGHYGPAGLVIAVNGSPPRGTVVMPHTHVGDHPADSFVWWSDPRYPKVLRPGRHEAFFQAIHEFLKELETDEADRVVSHTIHGAVETA